MLSEYWDRIKNGFSRKNAELAGGLKRAFTLQKCFRFGAAFLIFTLAGAELALALAHSFHLPEMHRGAFERFVTVSAIPFGLALGWFYRRWKKEIRRDFLRWQELALSLVLLAAVCANLYFFCDPYIYDGLKLTVSAADPAKQSLTFAGVYPCEWRNPALERQAPPLVSPYAMDLPDAWRCDRTRVTLQRIALGRPQPGPGAYVPVKKNDIAPDGVSFDLSKHAVNRGAFLSFQNARKQDFLFASGGTTIRMTIPKDTSFVAVPVLPAMRLSSEEWLPDKRLAALVLPGLLIAAGILTVMLRRFARILGSLPSRAGVPVAGFLCLAGLVLSLMKFAQSYSPDPVGQFVQGLTGKYAEWHPPMMAFVWVHLTDAFAWLFGRFSPVEPYLVLNCGLFWLGVFLIAMYAVRRKGFGAALPILFFGFIPFFFNEFRYLFQTTWKDSLLVSSYLAAIGLVLTRGEWKIGGRAAYLALTLSAYGAYFFGTAVRGNAILGAGMLAFLFFLRRFPPVNWKNAFCLILSAGLLSLATFGGVQYIQRGVLHMKIQNPMSYPMMKEVLAMHHITGDREWPSFLTPQQCKALETQYSYPRNNGGTDAWLHGQIHIANLPEADYRELKKFWKRKVRENPGAWLEQKNDSFRKQMRAYSPGFNPLFQAWHVFWLEIVLCAVAAALAVRLKKDRVPALAALAVSLSGLTYLATYYLFAFVPDFRYLSWFYAAGAAGFTLLLAANPQNSSGRVCKAARTGV